MVKDLKLDNELKMLALGVYEGNEKYIPKNWIKIDEHNSKNGFHGKGFIKNGVEFLLNIVPKFQRNHLRVLHKVVVCSKILYVHSELV